ncbi:MAG TPA: surface lipoprotein assembly modifier, partial [Gallionellaceae bacterium]
QNPPKEVSATIQKYLDIIETDRSGKASSIRGYVEFTVGHDSNVNTATSNKQIAVPFFGGAVMTMNDSGVANSDNFGSLGAGLNFRHSFNPEWAIVGGANVNQRNNSTQKTFNTGYADANFGLSRTDGNDNYMAVLQVQGFNLDGVRYRDAAGVSGQWQRNLDSGSQVGSYFQYTSLTYPDQTFRNADRYVLGGTYATPLASATPTIVYAGAYVGAEQARESNASYLGNTLFGGRVGGEMKLSAQYTLLASLSLESRMYGGDDPLFLTKRNDTQADLKAGINYMPAQQWTIGASIAYTSNDSNIAINKYDRTLFSVSLRRDFN